VTAEPDPLDERSLRRPDFAGGLPVRLGDGREWYVPRPRLRFVGQRQPLLWTVEGRADPEFAAAFLAMLDTMPDPPTAADGRAFHSAAAVLLLRANYRITARRARRLVDDAFADRNSAGGPWFAAAEAIRVDVVGPVLRDAVRVRGALPPFVEGVAVVGLN
jgi:hypothetical protein